MSPESLSETSERTVPLFSQVHRDDIPKGAIIVNLGFLESKIRDALLSGDKDLPAIDETLLHSLNHYQYFSINTDKLPPYSVIDTDKPSRPNVIYLVSKDKKFSVEGRKPPKPDVFVPLRYELTSAAEMSDNKIIDCGLVSIEELLALLRSDSSYEFKNIMFAEAVKRGAAIKIKVNYGLSDASLSTLYLKPSSVVINAPAQPQNPSPFPRKRGLGGVIGYIGTTVAGAVAALVIANASAKAPTDQQDLELSAKTGSLAASTTSKPLENKEKMSPPSAFGTVLEASLRPVDPVTHTKKDNLLISERVSQRFLGGKFFRNYTLTDIRFFDNI